MTVQGSSTPPQSIKQLLAQGKETIRAANSPTPLATISCVRSSITKQPDCEGIVNSANPNLRAGSGVCGAIYAAAGPELEPYSHALAPLALGNAVVTPAFNLANRVIIHTRGPKYHFEPNPSEYLAAALWNSLQLADVNLVKRLAVPAISTGVYAYPLDEAITILVEAASCTRPFLKHLEEIRFVVLDEKSKNIFDKVILRTVAELSC